MQERNGGRDGRINQNDSTGLVDTIGADYVHLLLLYKQSPDYFPCLIERTNRLDYYNGMNKNSRFELKADGTVERVGPFDSYGPTVEAKTKTEAMAKFLGFAYRAAENTPEIKIKNGAYQLAYESLGYGVTVESGVEGRDGSLCLSGVKQWQDLDESVASFDYYASDAYKSSQSIAA